jgi:hypothetical protein
MRGAGTVPALPHSIGARAGYGKQPTAANFA